MAGAQVAISALPASTTVVTTDVLGLVIGGTTKKITAGNFRSQLFAYAATDPLNCGILTAVGNSTVTGTLSGITTLTCTAVSATTVTATTLAGTLSTAAQTSITSVGTLTALSVSGNITMTAAVSRIVPGATSWAVMNTAGNVSNLLLSNAGFLTVQGGVQISTGNLLIDNPVSTDTDIQFRLNGVAKSFIGASGNAGSLIVGSAVGDFNIRVNAFAINFSTDSGSTKQLSISTAGSLVFGIAASKVIPGATSISLRNNADSADNLILTDAGVATIRAGLTVTAGGVTASAGNVTATVGNVAITAGSLTFGAAAGKLIPGATSFSLRNNADSADNLILTDAGVATIRAGLTVTAGNVAVTAGNLTFAASSAKIIPGATSILFRNNADTQTNLSILDGGAASFRSGLTIQGGSLLLTAAATTFSSLNMPSGTAPTSPADGDWWYNGTNLFFRNGVTTRTITWT